MKVIDGPRAGEVTTIISIGPLRDTDRNRDMWVEVWRTPLGTRMYELDLESMRTRGTHVWAPAPWLRLYREDHEPAEDVEEWIQDLCKQKERA